jgi:hypothetical protein
MTTTGTYTFSPEIAEIFEEAFERAGMAPQGIGGAHIRSALRSLKFMLNSEWSTIGVRQWMIDQGQETLSVGQTSFALPAGAIDVLHAVVRRNGQDIELDMVSRGDYLAIVDKHQKGRPDRYFVDRQASGPVMYIWQASENNTDVIVYDYFRQMQDVGEMTNTLQMPAYAYEACVSGLAYYLAVKFNPERAMGLRVAYGGAGYPARIDGGALERMRQEDRERGDLHLYAAIEPRSARR